MISILTIFPFQPLEGDLKGGDMVGTKSKNSLVGGLFLGLTLMLILTSPALAVETKWDALLGDWNIPDNWTNGVPLKNYDVIIDIPGADVTYQNSSNPTLNSLRLGLDPLNTEPVPDLWEVALTQEQDFLTAKNTEVGSKGTAIYNLNGGAHKVVQDLTLGTAADGEGIYNIMGGSLSVGGHETLGLAGKGYLLQLEIGNSLSAENPPSLGCTPPVPPPPPVGPTHSVGKNLYLGVESGSGGEIDDMDGEINLFNSSLTVGGSTNVGMRGTGLFNQDNSIVKIKGNYYPDPHPQVGEGILSYSPDFSALSKKNLKNNKLECVSNREPGLIVGLQNKGKYLLTGGTLNVNYSEIIGLDAGGGGTFIQSDGAHTINGNLYLGKEKDSDGNFDLSVTLLPSPDTPTPPAVGLLDIHGFASVGYLGTGSFLQTGGTVKIRGIDQEVNLKGKSLSNTLFKGSSLSCSQQQQYIGFTVGRGGIGTYDLDDGELLVSRGEIIGMLPGSNGTFSQFGGNHFIEGKLTIARDPGSVGKYEFSGGRLTAWGGIVNNGNFNMTKPDTDITPQPTAKMVIGDFINSKNGEVSINNTTVTFTKNFQNENRYYSALSTSTFKNLTVKPTGYFEVGAGDYINITGNFYNLSTRPGEWVTGDANVKFTGAGKHYFKTGSILDADSSVKNFNWSSLGMENGAVVILQSHLKAGQILNVLPLDQDKISNLKGFCGIQIDYLPGDTLNAYLVGKKLYSTGGRHVGTFTINGFDSVACH
jgi:hypothetical protein